MLGFCLPYRRSVTSLPDATEPLPPLTVVTHAHWRVRELAAHTETCHDFGVDLDAASEPGNWFWCPGAWAAAATTRHRHVRLSSAGPRWLDQLPIELTGREIVSYSAGELAATVKSFVSDSVFAKLPETKHERFAAAVRGPAALAAACSALPPTEPVQLQTPVRFTNEVRCWVRDGAVVAHSAYIPDVDRELWLRLAVAEREREAVARLCEWLDTGALTLPPAVVVDIGWCTNPATGSPGWRIVEANAAWSARLVLRRRAAGGGGDDPGFPARRVGPLAVVSEPIAGELRASTAAALTRCSTSRKRRSPCPIAGAVAVVPVRIAGSFASSSSGRMSVRTAVRLRPRTDPAALAATAVGRMRISGPISTAAAPGPPHGFLRNQPRNSGVHQRRGARCERVRGRLPVSRQAEIFDS